MADSTSEDFLYSSPVGYPAYAEPAAAEEPPRGRTPTGVRTAGWLAAGLAVGAVAVTVLHAGHSTAATGLPGAVAGNRQAPLAGGAPPPGFGGPPGIGGGGSNGEQHVAGTLTALSASTITVHSTSGTTTYRIDSTTQLVKDGEDVTSLSAMHVGDSVVVHVYPLNGTTHVERVIDEDAATTTT